MNVEVFAVLLFLGLIRDRQLQVSFPYVPEFIAAVRVTLGRCSLPPGWPSLAGPADSQVMAWFSSVVVWRRSRRRSWTTVEMDFINQLVACMKHTLQGQLLARLCKALIAEFDQLMSDCIYPVRERLKLDVEGFSDLPLDYNAISKTLAQAVVHGQLPGKQQSLPERFSLWPWVDQGYQYSIEDVVRTIVYGAIHRRGAPVSEGQDDRLFRRLMTGAIRQGFLVFYLEHVRQPRILFAMAKFLAVRCHNRSPELLALLLHPSVYKVEEKTGVQCLHCQGTYCWQTLAPLTWRCNCGPLPVYCPVCYDQLNMTSQQCQALLENGEAAIPLPLASQHVLVEKRRLVLRPAPQNPPAYRSVGHILKRCPTDTQIQRQVVIRLFEVACNQRDIPGVWLLEAVLWRKLGYRGCRITTVKDIPQSVLGDVTERLNKLGSYHTKKGKRATHTRDKYLAHMHEFLAYTGIRTDDTPCDSICRHLRHREVEQLVARYVNAREQETSKVHYVPNIATECPVPECFITDNLSQRESELYARFAWLNKAQAQRESETETDLIDTQAMSDEDRQIFNDTREFFRGLEPEVAAWAGPAANHLIEKPVGVDPQTWSLVDCKKLLTKLKEEYFLLLLDDDATPESPAFAELRAKAVFLLPQLEEQGVACQAENFDDFTWNVDDFVKQYREEVC